MKDDSCLPLLQSIRHVLAEAASQISRRDAESLLQQLLNRDRAFLLAHPEEPLLPETMQRFRHMVHRRANFEPLQYLRGEVEFFGLPLAVNPDVLIPRPETELLVEAVLALAEPSASALPGRFGIAGQTAPAEKAAPAQPPTSPPAQDGLSSADLALRVADVGTGSGAIALALATHLPAAQLWALDLSAAALEVARKNAAKLGVGHRVHFLVSDLLGAVQDQPTFDVIVSNPPYIPQGDAATMQPEVVQFEPHLALFAGDDGLAVYRRLVPDARRHLRAGGLLAMEIGFGQQPALTELLRDWQDVRFLPDYAGIPRVALAIR